MRQEIAEWVFPVFRRAIEIKEGLRFDEAAWDFSKCHQEMLALLQRPVPEPLRDDILGDLKAFDPEATRGGVFIGIRYALACWLDEIFIIDSAWREQWNNNKLETNLYDTNLRAHKFWEQADRALGRPGRDAIEAYFLCVMLGFRGEKADKPSELGAWRDKVEPQVMSGAGYTPPPGIKTTTHVHLLKGPQAMHKWFMVMTGAGLLFVLLIVYLIGNLLYRFDW